MKAKQGFILHKMGEDYMIVGVGDAVKQFDGFMRINETGAFIWKLLEKDTSASELANKLCENYENIDYKNALADVNEFLLKLKPVLDYEENN